MIFLIQDFLCFEVYTSTLWKNCLGTSVMINISADEYDFFRDENFRGACHIRVYLLDAAFSLKCDPGF